MSRTPSMMLELGTRAPDFTLPDTASETDVSLSDFDDYKGLLVVFMCNHCPYVKNIKEKLAEVAREYREKGVATVAISSNDAENYPDDRPDKMAEEADKFDYPFPYLYDESQDVAKKYRAACTPDFFLFNKERKLVYRGQFDDSRPGNDKPVTGKDLTDAMDRLLEGKEMKENQAPSVGCNIKWKAGNEPEYFG